MHRLFSYGRPVVVRFKGVRLGMGWVGSWVNKFTWQWVRLGQLFGGLGWAGSMKIDPRTTLIRLDNDYVTASVMCTNAHIKYKLCWTLISVILHPIFSGNCHPPFHRDGDPLLSDCMLIIMASSIIGGQFGWFFPTGSCSHLFFALLLKLISCYSMLT